MKLLFFTHGYFPAIGGAEKLAQQYAEGLVKKGHAVKVITTTAYNPEGFVFTHLPLMKPGEEEINGVEIVRVNSWRRARWLFNFFDKVFWKLDLPLKKMERLFWSGPLSIRMVKTGLTSDADVVTALPISLLVAYYGYFVARLKKVPFVLVPCFHVEEDSYNSFLSFFLLRSANAVITLTDYEKNYFLKKGVKEEKIFTIGVGVEPRKVTKENLDAIQKKLNLGDNRLVTFVGQQSGHKGIVELIRAMEIVWRSFPKVKLLIAGSKTEYSVHIVNTLNTLSSIDRSQVIYLESITEEEKYAFLQASNVFVTASGSESFGIVYLEAWSEKVPVVGTHSGAIPFVIDSGKNGLLARYSDSTDLANALLELLTDDSFAKSLGENGYKKYVESFTAEKITQKVGNLYQGLLRK